MAERKVTPGEARNAPADELTPSEEAAVRASDPAVRGEPRAPGPDTSGRRLRYIPYKGGTHHELRASDLAREGFSGHGKVDFNFRNNAFTAVVGTGRGEVAPEVAEHLAEKFPTMYEFMDNGE